jgi:uncharacterized membrane protein
MSRNEILQQTISHDEAKGIVQKAMSYQGMIPHPDILKDLKELDPSLPDRVIRMAEDTLKRNYEIANKQLDVTIAREHGFQRLFVFTLLALIATLVFLVLFGPEAAIVAFIVSAFAAVLVALIKKGARL